MTREEKIIKLIDILLIFIIPLFIIVVGAYIYFQLPTNGEVSVTGDLITADELVDVPEDLNLYGVTTRSITIEDRLDFIKFWWHDKKIHLKYYYSKFDEDKEIYEQVFDRIEYSLEKEKEAGTAMIEFVFDRYSEEEAVEVFGEFSWYDDYLGSSATLLMVTALIGAHEEKDWIYSDEKIVITGSFGQDGKVLPVGGVALKALTAKENDAGIFVVPKEQLDEAYYWISEKDDLEIVGVETFDELIAWLDENVE